MSASRRRRASRVSAIVSIIRSRRTCRSAIGRNSPRTARVSSSGTWYASRVAVDQLVAPSSAARRTDSPPTISSMSCCRTSASASRVACSLEVLAHRRCAARRATRSRPPRARTRRRAPAATLRFTSGSVTRTVFVLPRCASSGKSSGHCTGRSAVSPGVELHDQLFDAGDRLAAAEHERYSLPSGIAPVSSAVASCTRHHVARRAACSSTGVHVALLLAHLLDLLANAARR